MDKVQEETLVVFSHEQASGNGRGQRQEEQTSSPEPKAKAQTEEKLPSKSSCHRGRILVELGADFRAELSSKESARTRHEIIGTLLGV